MSSPPEMTQLPFHSPGVTRRSMSKAGSDLSVPKSRNIPTVLIVDDEPVVLEVRRLLLEKSGYGAIVADSGRQALEIFKRTVVDAIILDYMMPVMDGGQTAREIRKLDRAIPIILSTASVCVPAAVLQFFSAVVPKGSGPGRLLKTLERQIQRACRHRPRNSLNLARSG